MSFAIMRHEGLRGFYRGFGTSLMGTIPARALYMTALELQQELIPNVSNKYNNGIDACRKIVRADGLKGLYRGFGISILTYAPSNAVWWASYSVAHRLIWGGFGCYMGKKEDALSMGMGVILGRIQEQRWQCKGCCCYG
ncbi:solute carrier family 25 member 44 [Quercus suber]|uniref:Solute carrier family 25 member 44 n=1 Tax=Quercus suber TaxID=58331 RepID=A0AAW0JFD4_QUESU